MGHYEFRPVSAILVVWWVLIERFVNLCTGDNIFVTEDPRPNDSLPMDDETWERDVSVNAPLTSRLLTSNSRIAITALPFSRHPMSVLVPLPGNVRFLTWLAGWFVMSLSLVIRSFRRKRHRNWKRR